MPCTIKNPANIDLSDLEPHIQGMYDYFDQKLGFQKPPTMVFDSDPSNQSSVLGKTAYYDPDALEIHVYSDGRHPKDMLRSIAHELIHHQQNMEGRLDVGGYSGPGYYLENDKLRVIEHEAMLEGNKLLREYEDTIKKESKDMSLKEWKNNELNQRLMKKFGILKESQELEELSNNKNQPDRHRGNNQAGRLREEGEEVVEEGEEVVEEAQDEIEEGQSVRQGTEDRDVGRDRQRADRMHEDEEVVEEDKKPMKKDTEDADDDGKTDDEVPAFLQKENKFIINKNLSETVQKALRITKGK